MRSSNALDTFVAIVKVDVAVVLVPPGVTDDELKEQVANCGRPEQAKPTDWLKPPTDVTVVMVDDVCPRVTVTDVGLKEIEKFAGTIGAVMVSEEAKPTGSRRSLCRRHTER